MGRDVLEYLLVPPLGPVHYEDTDADSRNRRDVYSKTGSPTRSGRCFGGDRHSFWAGYAAAALPPGKFEPVGLSFIGASLVRPNTMEAYEHNLPKNIPLRPLFLVDREGAKPDWTFNMLLLHGVRSCLEYAKSFDLQKACALSNPDLAPHMEFLDLGGHGYAKVRLSPDDMRTEFVCIPRPITRSESPDGGPHQVSRIAHCFAVEERRAFSA